MGGALNSGMAMPAEVPQQAVVPSLQAGLDQLEAGIDRAHELLDRTSMRDEGTDKIPSIDGAEGTLRRCQDKVEALNGRLEYVVGAVGKL